MKGAHRQTDTDKHCQTIISQQNFPKLNPSCHPSFFEKEIIKNNNNNKLTIMNCPSIVTIMNCPSIVVAAIINIIFVLFILVGGWKGFLFRSSCEKK
jgi:hypothetical protein